MSDKTKFYADQALIARRLAQQRAREAANPRAAMACRCGNTPATAQILAAHDRHDRVTFYCEGCAPADAMAAFAASRPAQ